MTHKIGIRRLAAYAIDYVLMAAWMIFLAIVASSTEFGISVEGPFDTAARWSAQGQAFLMLTLPVYLYFTLCESFGDQATLGKRALGLRVDSPLVNIAARNLVKFAPWEIAHTGIWHGMTVPFVTAPNSIGMILFAISLGLSAFYGVGLFLKPGRTLYDRVSGTSVHLNPR